MWHKQSTLNSRGKLIDLEVPVVMGIINTTPDSFHAASRQVRHDELLYTAEKFIADGAAIIDMGGASSRPGAPSVSVQEELDRVLPGVELLADNFDTPISIDTFHAMVAKEAVNIGAGMVNDISGGDLDAQMFETIAALDVPYIIMHMPGTPQTMQQKIEGSDVTQRVLDSLIEKISRLRALEVKDIVIDPGFGFGKTLEQNYELLNRLHVLNIVELPILIGISRKSMIYKALETTSEKALNGTSALHMVALQQGASILRVHDVREAVEVVRLYELLKKNP